MSKKQISFIFLISMLSSIFIGLMHNVSSFSLIVFIVIGAAFLSKNFLVFTLIQDFKHPLIFKMPAITFILTAVVLFISVHLINSGQNQMLSEALREDYRKISGFAYVVISTQFLAILTWFICFNKKVTS